MSDSYDLSFLTGSSPELSANQNGLITPEQARDLATREIITGQRPDFSGSNPDVTLANESLYAQAKQQADIALGNVNTRSAGEAVQDTAVSGLQGAATLANMASLAAGGGAVQAASQQNSNIATAMALNQAWNNVRNFFSPPATEEEAQQRQDEVDRANAALYQSFNPDPASTGLYAAAQVNAAINDFIEEDIGSLHSDAYQQRKAEKDRRSEYLQQLSDAQYDQDVASGTSSLKAGLRQFGRDAINWIDENSSVADIVDTSANAAGQVLGQGAVIGAGRRMIAGPSTAALVQRARRVAEQRAQEEAAAQAVKNAADKAVAAARTDAERASARTAAQTATQNANLAHEAAEAAAIDLAMALKTAQEGAKAAAAKNVAEKGRQSFFNKVWDKTKSAGKTLVNHPGEMAFIGLQEGAGTIGSAAQKINQLSNEQLLEQSPLFRQYYERNRATGQDDKTALDNARVSLIAEAARLEMLQLPAAVVGASFTHAPGNVFGRISPRLNRGLAQNIRNVTGEAVEEAVTGTTGGLISNYAAGETYDPSQRLWSGVGSQAAQGFIASLGATSALNAPSATANTAIGAARIAASPVVKGIRSAKERARQENKQKAADILASANPSGVPTQQEGQTPQNQQEDAPVTPAQDQAGNINPTPTAAANSNPNPAPSSGSEGEVDLRTSTGPDERLDNSGILDDSDKSRDDLGRTEAMRYAQKQPDYIFGNQQEYNRLAQTMQTFNDDGAAEGIKELVQLNQNRDKLSPEEQQQLNENLEGLRNGAVDLINLYAAAKDRANGVSDTHRWDKRVFEDAEASGGFRTALENALYLYNNIQTTDNDIKLSEAARKKFINEAKEGNVEQDRLDNIIRHATEFGLTEEQANTLSYIKDTTQARAKAVQFDKSSGAGSVHNNIYNESDGAKFSVTDMIDGIADAAAAQDQAKLQFYLWKLDNLYNALTNKAEALTYGVNQQTGANIEYTSYNSETGEEYSATTYAGSMKQYRTIVKEQNDLADIRDALNQNLRTYYPQMFGDTQYVPSSKVKAANSELTQNYLKDKTTGEPKVKREANRTISIEERLSNGTHTSGTYSSQPVVSSNAANTGNTSVTTNNTQASAKQILDTVHKKSPSKGINLMYRKWKNLSLQHTTPTGGKGKNNYSIKFGKHLGGEDAANPYAAFLMMQLDPSESENIKKRFRSANRYKTLYRLRDALAKENYNGTPLKLRSEEDWNKIQKQVLLSCLIAKFNNEPESVQDLISTGNAPLYRYSKTTNGPVNMDLVLADGTTMSEMLELLRLAYQNLDAFGGKIPGDLEYSELISTLAQVVNNNNQNQENNPTEPEVKAEVKPSEPEVKEAEPEVKAEDAPAEPQNQKEVIEFTFANKKTNFLSNFYESKNPITYKGHTYKNAEAAFQAQKVPGHEAEFSQLSGYGAKSLGRKIRMSPQRVAEWNNQRINVMREIIRAKFNVNPELKEQLLATGDAELVETREHGDIFWGVDKTTGRGANNLGKLLMELRDQYRQEVIKQETKQVEEDLKKAQELEPGKSPEAPEIKPSSDPVTEKRNEFINHLADATRNMGGTYHTSRIAKAFTVIGSRETPDDAMSVLSKVTNLLGFMKVRTGDASRGGDLAARRARNGVNIEIYSPNDISSNAYGNAEQALGFVQRFHPNPSALTPYAQQLHARNTYQVLGSNLDSQSTFVLCYAPLDENGVPQGGTAQAIRISNAYGIPVINLAVPAVQELLANVQTEEEAIQVITQLIDNQVKARQLAAEKLKKNTSENSLEASEVIPVSAEPSFDTNVEEEGKVLRDNPVSKVIWNPRTGNLHYKLRNEDGSFRMLVRDGLYDDKGNLLDPATKEVWLTAEQINEIRSNLGMPVGQRVNIIDVIPPETDKENAGNITLSDGTKLRHNPVVDIAQGERVSVANHMKDNAEINRATTSHIANSILNSIRGTVFRAVKPENQTENQKADNDTLIRRLKDAVLGKRKNVDKALDDADTLVKGIELFKEWMNEVALHSQINTELNSGKFFQKMLEGKGRSLTDWVLGLSSTNNARVAVFMSVDSSGNLVFDDKVLTSAFLAMLQAINDNYTHNTMDEADLEEAVERLGLTMNQFMTLPEEVRQSFVNSIPSSALLQSFNRYFSALMGIRSNNEVSVSYDGDAMINALATQTLAYAQAMNWISYTTNAYTFTSETSGGTEVIQKNIPILEVTQEVKDAMSEAVNAKDYSIKLNSPLLLGSNREAITKLFTKKEGFKREFYPNEEMPPLETSHKVRTDTEYTKDELKAKAAMRNTKYYLNKRFGKLITTLGTEGLLAIRGIDIDPNSEEQRHTYNWKIWDSLVGTRQSLIASYDYNINRMDNLLAIAEQEGIEDPYLRFDFEMTAAGRWMETAPLGPQADKLARQLFTQVRTKITRTKNGTSLTEWSFKLAVLQALGVKLPKFASAEEAADRLEQQFAQVEAIAEHYGDWLEENPDFDDLQTVINQMFADLKAAGFDPMGRSNGGNVGAGSYLVLNTMLNMSDWVKGNDFDCNIFLEHDGSTNGYVNAVFKFASGSRFNEAEVQALFRGSIFPGLGLNRFDYYSKDKEDNYTAVASEAQTSIANFIEEQQDPVVKNALKQMFRAINLIIGNFGDADNTNVSVVIEDNQVYLKVGRNMVKTPVTAVNYGQGENSNAIALFQNIIEDTVYQKISDAIKYITPNSKQTFGEVYYAKEIAEGTLTKEQANDYFNEIIFTLDVMYTHKFAPAVDTKGKRLGYDVLIPNRAKAKDKSFIDFKDGRPLFDYFNGKTVQKAFENFRFDLLPKNKYQKEGMGSALRNFRKIFADHIFSAVHDLRGGDAVEASMQAINNVTNAMGTVAARLEKKFIQDCINATGRMPSRKELQDFKKKHSWAYPVYTGMTNLNLGVTENTNITDFSSSSYASGVLQMSRGHKDIYNLAGKGAKTITPIYSTPRIPISTLPSVRSLALMVIGLGDGVMQTWFYSHKDYFLKKYGKYGLTEEIFNQVANRYDGFEGSPALQPVIAAMCNEAAFGVLEENPLEGINAVFKNFKQNLFALAQEDIDLVRELIAGTDQFIELDLELGIPLDPNEKSMPSAPPSGSDTFEGQLQMLADTNKAKHDVLHEMPVNVSHVSINEFGYTHNPNGEYLDVLANVGTAEELAVYTAEALSQRVEKKLAKNQKTEAPGNVTLSSTKGTRGTNQKESDISINGKNPNSPGRAPTPPKTHLDWTKVFTNALHKVFGSIQTGSVFKDIIERNLPAGTQVKIMSRGDIIKEQPNAGMDDTTKTALYTSNTIYIVDDGNLTSKERDIRIAHEMVHAVLSYKLNKAYSHTLNDSAAHRAAENLEYLKDQFLAMDFTQNKDLDLNVRTRLISIQRILSEYDGVEAVDEFVAYMLSDPLLKEYLSETTPNETSGVLAHVKEFFNLVKSFVQQVGTLLGIHSKSDLQLLSSFYGQIAVNANVIIDSEYSSEPETGDLVRFMKRGSSTYLQDVIQKMSDTLTSSGLIASKYAGKDQQVTNLVNALTQDMDTALSQAAVSGLLTTPEEVKAARFVMAVFAYNLKGKEAAYQEADALRNVVKKTLHTDDFLENQNWAQAQAQLEILTNMRGYQARSNPVFTNGITYQYDLSLPLFMALATVSPKVRQVLSNKTLTAKDLALGKANEVEIYDRPIDRKIAEVCRNTISSLGSMVMPKSRRITKTGTADAIADMFMEDMANQKVDTAARSIPSTLMTKGETWTKNAISKASGFLAGSEFIHNLQASDNKFGKLAGNAIGGTMQYISIVTSSDGQAEDINQRIHGNLSEKAYDLSKKQGALAKLRGNLILEFTREILHADNYSDLIQQFEKKMKALVAQARSNYRKVVPLEIHRMFRNEGVVLTDAASASMNKVILKPDLGALTNEEVRNILTGTGNNLEAQVRHFEAEIMKDPNINKAAAERIMRTSRELADYMIYGKVAFGLLRNPYSILFNAGAKITNENLVLVNKYITLLALKRVSAEDMSTVREIYSKAPNSFEFSLNQQRRMAAYEEARGAASEAALFNRTKGWYPQTATSGASIIAVSAQDRKKYEALGYVVVKGSAAVRNYVYMTNVLNPRANFSQGALQTIMHCAGGADITSGFTTEPVVLRVNPNNRSVNWGKVNNDYEHFVPVFDQNGKVKAYDCLMDTRMVNNVYQYEQDFAKNLGNWLGRQFEEDTAQQWNLAFIDALHQLYQRDVALGRTKGYINLYRVKDPVIQEALSLINPEAQQRIQDLFPEGFYVRRDMVDDVIGHRKASVVDMWTGKSRWSPEAQKAFRDIADKVMGKNACQKLLRAEKVTQALTSIVRNKVVIVSGTVALANLVSNFKQLVISGVPLRVIATETPKIIKELEIYNKSQQRIIALQLQLNSVVGSQKPGWEAQANSISAEIKAEQAAHTHLTIAPLLAAGEYSTIADIGDVNDDLLLSMGKWGEYIDNVVDQIPEGVKNTARYITVAKGTPIYNALEKMTKYGDFVSKAILYNYLVNQGMEPDAAMRRVRYEFVNYDMLPGRGREYLENMGVIWFYNYKLRSVRVFLSMMKHNPIKAVTMSTAGGLLPGIFDSGTPMTDNIVASALTGKALYTAGPQMMLSLPTQNLWYQLFE